MRLSFTKFFATMVLVSGTLVLNAQNSTPLNEAEAVGSGNNPGVVAPSTQALLDNQFTYDITAAGCGTGNAGMVNLGNEFWVSKWQSDTVWVLDNSGVLQSSFNIPMGAGGGIRAMTTDGSNVYASQNGAGILVISITSQTVTSTIPTSVGFNIRSVTYDATANGGAGGFWVSNFDTDIVQISMAGTMLNSIPALTHGLTGMYGTAFDNMISTASQTLWIYNQPANPGAVLWQLETATGALTGATLDVNASLGYSALAGGVCIATGLQAEPSLCALAQQAPNSIDGFELTTSSGINDPDNGSVSIFPIPATDYIYFVMNNLHPGSLNVKVFDVSGKMVESFKTADKNVTLNTSQYTSGVYSVMISDAQTSVTKKFMVK